MFMTARLEANTLARTAARYKLLHDQLAFNSNTYKETIIRSGQADNGFEVSTDYSIHGRYHGMIAIG